MKHVELKKVDFWISDKPIRLGSPAPPDANIRIISLYESPIEVNNSILKKIDYLGKGIRLDPDKFYYKADIAEPYPHTLEFPVNEF